MGEYEHEDLLDSLPISNLLCYGEAINLSQMFPIMSASARVDSNHYYDGGIYDNSGLSTIRDIYKVLSNVRDEEASGKKIIILYAENSKTDRTTPQTTAPSGLSSLVKAASGSIFDASTSRHIEKLKKSVSKVGDEYVEELFYNSHDITLNRWLSESDCKRMNEHIERHVILAKKYFKNNQVRSLKPQKLSTSIYFDSGKSDISPLDTTKIRELLDNLNPQNITLTAFTDIEQNSTKNDTLLALSRYESVKEYLENNLNISSNKIAKPKVVIHEKGSDKLSKQLNRRVDLSFIFYQASKAYVASPRGK